MIATCPTYWCPDRVPTPEEVETALAGLLAEGMEPHIARIIVIAPPLSARQRDVIATILRPGPLQ